MVLTFAMGLHVDTTEHFSSYIITHAGCIVAGVGTVFSRGCLSAFLKKRLELARQTLYTYTL